MEAVDTINGFREFFEKVYEARLKETIRKGFEFIIVDFSELMKFDHELSDAVLDYPEESMKAAEEAILDLSDTKLKKFNVRFSNLSEGQTILIRDIRSKHIGKLLMMEGIVRQKSDVRPQVTSAKFECPSCGNVINVLQLDSNFKEPTRCGCGRKGKFRILKKELVDAQGIVLEEDPENLEGGEQPKRMNILLQDDLVSPMSERKTNPGSKIKVVGSIKEIPIFSRSGSQTTRFDLLIEANNVEAIEEDYYNVEISEDEEKEIKELGADPHIYQKLIQSMAPSIYGHERVKEAIILQLVGGVHKKRTDGVVTRGDMHVLLIGDPGSGKCVAGDTSVVLNSGEIISVKELFDNNAPIGLIDNQYLLKTNIKTQSINFNGLNFNSNISRVWRRKAPKKMLKIITNTGNEIIVTQTHPIFTTKNGVIFAKMAKDYKKGEYIASPSRLNTSGELQSIPKNIKKTTANNRVKYDIKEFFDCEFARLFGYLVGDGYVKERPTTGLISFTNNDIELLDDFEKLIYQVFKLKVSKRRKQNSNSFEYYISSIDLIKILKKIDPNIVKRSKDMGLNKLLVKSPKFIVKEFLKSLFDCEGHVNNNKREIEFTSKSKNLIFDLRSLLLRFGIISQISSSLKCATNTLNKTKRRYYRLKISGEDIIKFYREIGFVSSTKQSKLKKWTNNKIKLNTNLNVVPGLNTLLKVLRQNCKLSQFSFNMPRSSYQHYERGDRLPSYVQLKIISQKYNQLNAKDPLIEILNQISKADIFWDKIKTVEEIEFEGKYVYDLEIGKVHNFVANGLIVHNSQLLKRAQIVAPKSRYVSGKGVSGAGLTASVVKDEFLKGWSLEAGALVLANKGICMIDEMDKMSPEDRDAMHEALEQQTVSISKANIQATLRCETTVLAAANPKFGRFDPYDILAKQIDMPPSLINRFDLIFPIKDLPDREKDTKLASHILDLHQKPNMEEPAIPTKLLRKYISYIRQKIKPKLTTGALEEIKEYYVNMRNSGGEGDAGTKAIPISARQLEALVRLAEGSAKTRLADKVTRKDAKRSIDLLHFCLSEIGIDPETGKIDIDRIGGGITASQRNKVHIIKEIIDELENKIGKTIPLDDLIKEAEVQGVKDIEEVIEKLKRSGDIFEPKRGFIQKI